MLLKHKESLVPFDLFDHSSRPVLMAGDAVAFAASWELKASWLPNRLEQLDLMPPTTGR